MLKMTNESRKKYGKETYTFLKITEADTMKQAKIKEKIKRIYQKNEDTIRNQNTLQKSH